MIYSIIAIILESFSSLFKSIDTFLNTRELTVGAILIGLAPFVVILNRITKEKEKRERAKRIEKRQKEIEEEQLYIHSDIRDLMKERGVVSTWSSPGIGSINTVQPMQKRLFSYLPKVTIRKRRMIMEKLKSRKFWMTIAAALIPIINEEFGLNLDLDTLIIFSSALLVGVGFIAHVDAKKILAGIMHVKVTPQNVALAYTTYKEALPHLQEIHSSINKLLVDVKQDNTSEAFKDAMSTYVQIKAILDSVKHPEPVIAIVDEQVPA